MSALAVVMIAFGAFVLYSALTNQPIAKRVKEVFGNG